MSKGLRLILSPLLPSMIVMCVCFAQNPVEGIHILGAQLQRQPLRIQCGCVRSTRENRKAVGDERIEISVRYHAGLPRPVCHVLGTGKNIGHGQMERPANQVER